MICEDDTDDAARGLNKLRQAHWDLCREEMDLADSLDADGGDPREIADARKMAEVLRLAGNALDVNDETGCIEAHDLTELAWGIKRKAIRLGCYTEAQIVAKLDEPPGTFDRDQGCGRSP
eukprot:4149784-Prymnesium_polylepis.1